MTKQQLAERIQKTQSKIEKIEKRIKKWQDAQCEKEFIKKDGWLLNMGRDKTYLYNEYIKECNWELDRAIQDLHDTQLTLEKYQNALNLEVVKDNEFENNRIIVIWDFLLHYKEQVAKYIRNNMTVLNEYYEVDSEMCDWHNGHRNENNYKEHLQELRQKERELEEAIHPITKLVAKSAGYHQPKIVDEDKLNEILLKECKLRYFQLVDEVTKYTGIITDATNLNMRGGELNGIIIGEKGKAKVQTFSAGGWNIQCFHYRTKVTNISMRIK